MSPDISQQVLCNSSHKEKEGLQTLQTLVNMLVHCVACVVNIYMHWFSGTRLLSDRREWMGSPVRKSRRSKSGIHTNFFIYFV